MPDPPAPGPAATRPSEAGALGFPPEELRLFYRSLLLPRMIEEKMLVLLRQGRLSKWFSGIGQEAIAAGDRNKALEAMKEAEPQLMSAARRGQLHRNTASRKVSRLSKRIAKLAK